MSRSRRKGRMGFKIFCFSFISFLYFLSLSLYDVQHAPFLSTPRDGPAIVAAVIIPPCTLNTVIPEFLRRVVYGNPGCAAINILLQIQKLQPFGPRVSVRWSPLTLQRENHEPRTLSEKQRRY